MSLRVAPGLALLALAALLAGPAIAQEPKTEQEKTIYALGLAVAVGVYLFDRRPAARLAQESPPMTRDEAPAAAKTAKPAPASQDAEAETQFEFYDMLPKFEVVIPEQDGTAAPATGPD